jgi:hypothetical protein
MTEVIGTVFSKKGQIGDFEWHIKSGLYEDSLFLFNDDEKRRAQELKPIIDEVLYG